MTDAELAAVVASAKASVAAIEDGVAKAQGIVGDRERIQAFESVNPRPSEIFDRNDANRMLEQRSDHPEAGLVREAGHLLTAHELRLRFLAIKADNDETARKYDPRNAETQRGWHAGLADVLEKQQDRLAELDKDLRTARTQVPADSMPGFLLQALQGPTIDLFLANNGVLVGMKEEVARERFLASGGIEVTAIQLREDFDANEIAALQKYGKRPVRVTGTVTRISADLVDEPVVHLATGRAFKSVSVTGVPVTVAAELSKGQEFVAICERIAEVAGSPICHSSPRD